MKWLQNSDLRKNEGSFDIFKAICNENENDEENEIDNDEDKSTKEFDEKRCNFTSKLKNVQIKLKQLEAEIDKEMENENENEYEKCAIDDGGKNIKDKHVDLDDDSSDDDDDADEGASADGEFIIKRNGKTTTSSSGNRVLSKENKKYLLLKSSVNMLREAYNEICYSVREQGENRQKENNNMLEHKAEQLQEINDKEESPPLNIKVKTQLPIHAISPTIAAKTFELSESDIIESDSDVESLTLSSPVNTSAGTTVINVKTEAADSNHALVEKLHEYQSQVDALNEKLQQTELEAQHTLEIMQVECDDVKIKMESLNKIIDNLKNEKMSLEKLVNESRNNSLKQETISETSSSSSYIIDEAELKSRIVVEKELELEEDPILNAINATALEREEELVLYKERLDEQQKANIELRNEIALLKLKTNVALSTKEVLFKQILPYSFVVLAIIVYFLTTYF